MLRRVAEAAHAIPMPLRLRFFLAGLYHKLSTPFGLAFFIQSYVAARVPWLRERFLSRWQATFSRHGSDTEGSVSTSADPQARGRILFIDLLTPTPDRDSGSVDAFNFMCIFRRLGFDVTFIASANLAFWGRYTAALQQRGIDCQYYPYISSVKDYIRKKGDKFDIVLLSRLSVASQYMDLVRDRMPRARVIFNTVDLHFLREGRQARVLQRGDADAGEVRHLELGLMRRADCSILVSEGELELIRGLDPEINVTVVPIPREVPGRRNGFAQRRDIVFIGGYLHQPNVDAVHFFMREIWPLITPRLPDARFIIAGSNMPGEFEAYRSEAVVLQGYVEDLDSLFEGCRITVAPLRFGAGVKGKIVTSLSYGVPCVATPIAAEGMGLEHGRNILCAPAPEEFAEQVISLYTSPDLWLGLSDNGLDLVKRKYSLDVVQDLVAGLLDDLLGDPYTNRRIPVS